MATVPRGESFPLTSFPDRFNPLNMSLEDPTPDEFDAMLQEIPLPESRKNQGTLAIDIKCLQPEVARALIDGMAVEDVAEAIGVAPASLRKRMGTMKFADLLAVESRRVMAHLSSRDLAKEKYLGLATAVSGMIRDMRMLNNEPTDDSSAATKTQIQNITIALFGLGGRDGSADLGSEIEAISRGNVQEIPPQLGPGEESLDAADDVGGDLAGVRGES